jgi:hypothetical protein
MNRNAKLLAVSLAGLACSILVTCIVWVLHTPEIALARASSEPLTDLEAIELSREALRRSGHEADRLAPQKFQNDTTNYYARNTISPFSGYVLWSSMPLNSTNPNNEAFMVQLEQRGTQVLCRVNVPK